MAYLPESGVEADAVQRLSTTTINALINTTQQLFTVPASKRCIVTSIIARDPNGFVGEMQGSLNFGFGFGAEGSGGFGTDVFEGLNTSDRIAILNMTYPTSNIYRLGMPGEDFGCVCSDRSVAAEMTIDVFGYLIDA